ncbi:MAG TPA: LysM domain-containing protein [Phycisphaerae bacterium]|jgi:nucleoid-associated protein YgaU
MRTDVKIGAVLGTFLLVIGGWYYLGREKPAADISLGGAPRADGASGALRTNEKAPAGSRREPADGVVSWEHRPAVTAAPPPQPPPSVGDEKGPNFIDEPPRGTSVSHTSAGREQVASAAPGGESPSDLTPAAANLKEILDRQTLTPDDVATAHSGHAGAPGAAAPDSPSMPGGSVSGPTAPEASGPALPRTYKVGHGDTLALIAETYYGSQKYAAALMAANPQITNKEIVRVGTILNIPPLDELTKLNRRGDTPALNPEPRLPAAAGTLNPQSEPRLPAAAGTLNTENSYTVKPGDTFYSIATRLLGAGGRWKELFELNKDAVDGDPGSLKIGQVLKLPTAKKN